MSGVRARFGEGQKRVSLGTMVDVAVGMMFVLKYSFWDGWLAVSQCRVVSLSFLSTAWMIRWGR